MLQLFKSFVVALLLLAYLSGCGGGSNESESHLIVPPPILPGSGSAIFDENEKSYLYRLFLTEYYWSDYTPKDFDTTPYTEPQPMVDALKHYPPDQWSFALSWEQYDQMASQSVTGFGFLYENDFTILSVFIDSPAQIAGLHRGDKILTIGGKPASEALLAQARESVGQATLFGIERGGEQLDVTITSQAYNYKVISYKVVLTPQGQRVGYLRFDEFTDNATFELEAAFTYFKAQAIDKLVVDLRYNPGGSVTTASIFLDKIGRNFNGQAQFSLIWNPQNSYRNETLYFDSTDPNSLALDTLIYLTTENSASASELIINAMEPYMPGRVITVGTKTHGKPVGMDGRTSGNYIYFLINFTLVNADGYGDYFDGLPADCPLEDDDFAHSLGDPNEKLLNEALYYIDNNHC
jgi:hypothetical protein